MSAALCHHYDIIWSHNIIGQVTIRLSLDDFLYILNRNQTRILFSFQDIMMKSWCHNAWINYLCGPNRETTEETIL